MLSLHPGHRRLTDHACVQGVGAADMRGRGEVATGAPIIGIQDTFTRPGVYTLEVPCPRTRSTATVQVGRGAPACSPCMRWQAQGCEGLSASWLLLVCGGCVPDARPMT